MARVGGEEIDLTPTDGMAKEAQKGESSRRERCRGAEVWSKDSEDHVH